MAWPFKDYDFMGDRYVNIIDKNGETIMWYDRENVQDGLTECAICREAENNLYTRYAHPKAHEEAHNQASSAAQLLAIKEKVTEDYIDYYTFYYGRIYRKIYIELYNKYKEDYSAIVLERDYTDYNVCQHHLESIQYHLEQTQKN